MLLYNITNILVIIEIIVFMGTVSGKKTYRLLYIKVLAEA